MEFKFYNPAVLIPIFRERGIFDYDICQSCVLTNVSPEYCFHPKHDFAAPYVQSDMLCPHCFDTVELFEEPFHLHEDKDLTQKVAELEEIFKMAFVQSILLSFF